MDDIRRADVFKNEKCFLKAVQLSVDQRGLFDLRLPLYGYTTETVNMLLIPMFKSKKEALGSMGNDRISIFDALQCITLLTLRLIQVTMHHWLVCHNFNRSRTNTSNNYSLK